MIKIFRGTETEKIWKGIQSRKLPTRMQQLARRKLRMLNNAEVLKDLRIPPANRLEKLKGKLSKYHSIRVNDKWRIIFKWQSNHAYEVEIVDYHD